MWDAWAAYDTTASGYLFKEKINAANRFLLPMADLARHQLTIETNLALNGGATGHDIPAVSRVGSLARRHMQ